MLRFFSASGLQYFNLTHIFFIFLTPIVCCAMYFLLRSKPKATQYKTMMLVFLGNGILFVTYKVFMFFSYDTFEVLNELPLHLCNLNVILLPVALKTKNKFLLNYLYYIGTIGAIAAVVLFDTTFLDKPTYDYGVFIYFFYHTILLVSGILLATFGFFTPSLKGIFYAMATLMMLATFMHVINTVLRVSGACPIANYFYTYGMQGNPLLDALMKFIPVPVLYMLPILPVVGIINCLMYFPFLKRHRQEEKEQNDIINTTYEYHL